LILAAIVFALTLTLTSCGDGPASGKAFVTESRNADFIPLYGILELSFKHYGVYENNFFDVTLDVIFTSPGGTQRRIKGFYYGGDLWMVRFRPHQPGRWTYTYVLTGKGNFRKDGNGAFDCTPGSAEGLVRRHPQNTYRWVFANGKAYFPIGLQDCFLPHGTRLRNHEDLFEGMAIDGGKRSDKMVPISVEEYFSIYGQAGFNLFRFSQKNCSYILYNDLDNYRIEESIATDKLLSLARNHGFRVLFGFFGSHGNWTHGNRLIRVLRRAMQKTLGRLEEAIEAPDDQETIAKEKRFIEYSIARWGVYVDFWELLNERKASDKWTNLMADHVRSVDPDRKPVSTSWEKPYLPSIDINTPHWYESESELTSDLQVQQKAAKWKQAGKPVIVSEQGNTGMNWDPRSGLRMRIRTWTALFQEISFIFWNTSWSKAGMFNGHYTPGSFANIYLGPEERGFIRVLQDFSARLNAGVRMVPVEVSSPEHFRAYGLLSSTVTAAYLHHFKEHTTKVHGAKITLELPGKSGGSGMLVGEWIEPSTGNVVLRVRVPPGQQTLDVPPFTVDLALLVTREQDTPSGPPG
jgi:hypothetical protein